MSARLAYLSRLGGRCLLLLAPLTLLGCEATLKQSPFVINNLITRVTDASGNVVATLHQGAPPTPNGGPQATVSGFAAMVNGGSAQQTVSASPQLNSVIIASVGMSNYYELTLPAGTPSTDVILTAAPSLSSTNVGLTYAATANGIVGNYAQQNVRVIGVGTGDVQVSVSWSDSSDVDLHVVGPDSVEIFYDQRSTTSGGTLDLDSNAACTRDNDGTHKSNENIVWPAGHAPHGSYTVRLDYWSYCQVSAPTQYVVTVVSGGNAQVFTGNFTGSGDQGGRGDGRLITTFTY